MADELITLAEQKVFMEVTVDTWDTRIQSEIDSVIADAEDYLGAKLQLVEAESVILDGGKPYLILPHLNISNVTIWEDADREFLTDDVLDSAYYILDAERGRIRRSTIGSIFTSGRQVIKVQYDGGYVSADCPKALKGKLMTQIHYNFRRRGDIGINSVSHPDGSISKYETGQWLKDVRDTLDRYARHAG